MIDVYSSARAMAAAVAAREISARELLALHLARIEQVNGTVNALVSIDADRAYVQAAKADDIAASGARLGPLHGLPYAVKDTHHVAGWRTTFGSPVMVDHVSTYDDLVVERVRAAGAVIVAKSNTPEFAAGSHTFNPVFGTTLNPYDTSRSAGGSSGGAAAALASGMVALADGSDMGGSLRNPASFCNVVGLRPSWGRVPTWPTWNLWETVSVQGPLARDVDDLALLLSVLAGPDPRVPSADSTPGGVFADPAPVSLDGLRVAFSIDLGGAFEVDTAVAAVVRTARAELSDAGAVVADAWPDLPDAEAAFRTLRAWLMEYALGDVLDAHPGEVKQSLADNIRAGRPLSGHDVAVAYAQRSALAEKAREFFETYDVLVMPVSQVPPFPADQEFPAAINGRPQESYLDWMRSAFFVTVTGCPAISVPAGFTPDGLPVGVQLVGPAGSERRLLAVARAYEAVSGAGIGAGGPRPAL
ncbi:amidase [Mumia zhuanghuii]|uniref:Amidase n=2 Tax=Mumia TaxID=1546255 RepID=A0ABW1QIL8_9ACTN|nr:MULTISPECIES: amidase [Mumia]KAA1422635.1 amidase [Mumia zhuanghuii]